MRPAIILLLITVVSLSACNKKQLKGQGNDVTDTVEMAAFSHVKLLSNHTLVIEKSNNYDVIITGHPDLVGAYVPQVKDDTLLLQYDPYYTSVKDDNLTLKIRMPYLYGLYNAGKGDITVIPGFYGDKLAVSVSGQGDVFFNAGNFTTLDASLSSAAKLNASQLVCDSVYARVSSGGIMDVYPMYYLFARVTGSGTINYYHQPDTADLQASGAGAIIKK